MQYQQSPPPRLNGVLQNLHWRFRQKVWELFCPNFNGRPPTGTTSQSHSLDSEDEDEEENRIFQAQDDSIFDSLFDGLYDSIFDSFFDRLLAPVNHTV